MKRFFDILSQVSRLHVIYLISAILLVVGFVWGLNKVLTNPPTPTVEKHNSGRKVNLNPDIGFLKCIGVQHSCIYDNIKSGNAEFIVENCGDENACNSGVKK